MQRYGGEILYAALPLHMQRGCFRIQSTRSFAKKTTNEMVNKLSTRIWDDSFIAALSAPETTLI